MSRLYWITGLAGAGKSTLAARLHQDLIQQKSNVVLLDGDVLREVYGLEGHYEESDRLSMAKRHARMCHLLTSQNIDVICATISMFDEVRDWNREHHDDYLEIYLVASAKTLAHRNSLRLYSNNKYNRVCHVVGQDIQAQVPKSPDIILINEGVVGIEPIYQELQSFLKQRNCNE